MKQIKKKGKKIFFYGSLSFFFLFFIFLVLTIYASKYYYSKPTPTKNPLELPENQASPEDLKSVKILYHLNQYEGFENFYCLYTGEKKSDYFLKDLTTKFKQENCTKKCSIIVYDDEEAYRVSDYVDKSKITTKEEIATYQKYYEPYLADHYIALLDQFNTFTDYPIRVGFPPEKFHDKPTVPLSQY